MIDDKKIEEAARGAADLYEQDLPIMSYDEDKEIDGQHHFCQDFGAELFKDGVKWAINEFLKDLWHPASEKPRRYTICLAQIGKYVFDTFYDSENWESYSKGINITRWLYVDDLIPKLKEGDEQ